MLGVGSSTPQPSLPRMSTSASDSDPWGWGAESNGKRRGEEPLQVHVGDTWSCLTQPPPQPEGSHNPW